MYLNFVNFWGSLIESRGIFFEAAQMTLALTAISILIAIFIGLMFAFMKISKIKPLEWLANIYIYVVRGTPLIVQIFVFYYGLTEIWMISGFWSVALGLAFHNGAYIAEIFRGSIQSIGKGQTEAGRSLGMSNILTMRRIILPQAFRRALPPLGNQFIIGLKDSSLAAFIGVSEIFAVATTQGSNTFDYMTWLLVSAVWYLILVFLLTLAVSAIEKKMAVSD
ncbi:amino acid ABC transporter membrane protein, PAAT family (TC 3.A.1.3.-) [Halobacillus dabanensis]|uniref:Amino acid ABC transporter membrane protein, PAAT family (TC 3.A.1.3.-) n=1 Tax=Halobacillus dabanensis TaxID=240302 RepID=A0A1I3P2I0_HALDA|nr:amino acid ABC transporter permease [Halobacillus dabanensis]SFJ15651.1 amino acid ABC transporter membrane protein, PAAT family (TC 3.A.1.3.-) [Halobacillus dabanensis]